jgi:hypothetical protein
MASHVWAILCSRAITDTVTNQISLIDSIEALNLGRVDLGEGGAALVPISIALAVFAVRDDPSVPEQFKVGCVVEKPGGECSERHVLNVSLEIAPRARTIFFFQGLNITGPGYYWFKVDYYDEISGKWCSKARVPLEVVIAEEVK